MLNYDTNARKKGKKCTCQTLSSLINCKTKQSNLINISRKLPPFSNKKINKEKIIFFGKNNFFFGFAIKFIVVTPRMKFRERGVYEVALKA